MYQSMELRPDSLNHKTLLCTNIPELFLDKYVARKHFGCFGTLVNFVLRPQRMTCTVSYANESEAALALREGSNFNGHQFYMCYAENESAPAQKTEEWVDPDVQEELSVLSGDWRTEYNASSGSKSNWTSSNNSNSNSNSSSSSSSSLKSVATDRQSHTQFMAAKHELEALMYKSAYTTEEKYRVLDARDKLQRLNMRRATDLMRTTSTNGCCPDMCPEKERLLREFQRQVAVYELAEDSDDVIDHHRAIKQYSRSSADQESPLPHELRPEPVLHMTMAYLMHEIMDCSEQPDTHIGDWFHFLWDRTRSIRKEITQQELCSLGAVRLVEQCARFHIHCAARLVAEDPSVFDSKINAENLTKCLQTLKYLYHDLRLKGVQCPREAEFRGYIVLLNLADANFLWDIGQLPVELQSCPQIKHAIKFYLALQDTNFVRFFQLVRDPETTYLSACILVAYFTRLRVLALRRLVQSYRAPRKLDVSALPLGYVSKMLGCASEEEAADFVEHYGMRLSDGSVQLRRMDTPETDFKLQRQLELVESKRQQSAGECICGEPLPPKALYQNHRPHNSFNEQGCLMSAAWSAEDQLHGRETVPQMALPERKPKRKSPTDNLFKMPLVAPKSKAPNAAVQAPAAAPIMPFSGNIFKIKPTQAGNTASGSSSGKPTMDMAQKQPQKGAEESKLFELQRKIVEEKKRQDVLLALKQKRDQEQAQREKQLRRQQEEAKLRALQEQQEQKQQQQRQQQQRQQALLDAQCEQLLHQLLRSELVAICDDECYAHRSALQAYNAMLDTVTAQLVAQTLRTAHYELRLMRCYWRKWRSYQRVQQHKDELFARLPLSFCAEASSQLTEPTPAPLHMIRRYRHGEPCNFRALLQGLDTETRLQLDLWQLLSQALQSRQHTTPGTRKFFKLLLSLPEGAPAQLYEDALQRGLLLRPLQPQQAAPPSSCSDHAYIYGLAHGVALCARKLTGRQLLDERHQPATLAQLANADGIVLFYHRRQTQEMLARLRELMARSGAQNAVLIVVEQQSPQPDKAAAVAALKAAGVQVSSLRLLHCPVARPRCLVALLEHAVQMLAALPHRARSELRQAPLREWLIGNLSVELFNRLQHAVAQDASMAQQCRQSPHFGLRLYNEAVRRLQLVAGEDLQTQPGPQLPEELSCFVLPQTPLPDRLEYFVHGWQTPAFRDRIVLLLEQAKLPDMPPLPVRAGGALQSPGKICEWLLDYALSCADEAQVESVAIEATMQMAMELHTNTEHERNYLGIVQTFAMERLQLVLRRAQPPLPPAIVYRRSSMRTCFDSQWYYEWQRPPPATAPPRVVPIRASEETAKRPEEAEQQNPLSYDQVIARAEDALARTRERGKRKSLTDLNKLYYTANGPQQCAAGSAAELENLCANDSTSSTVAMVANHKRARPNPPPLKRNESPNQSQRQHVILQRANKFL